MMLSIQGFVTIVHTFSLLLVLGLLLKLYRAVQNWDQRRMESDRHPVPSRERRLLQDEWKYNNSVPCNRKRATEHDENSAVSVHNARFISSFESS